MKVDRCVCCEITFAELKVYADRHRCGLPQLRERFNCGRGCGLCMPYIREMLRTGQTEIPLSEHAATPSSL